MQPASAASPRVRFGQNWTLSRALAVVVGIRILAAIVFLATGGQIGFRSPDSGLYLQLAAALQHGSFYTFGVPQVFRPPGYPLFLVPAVASGHVIITGITLNFVLAAFSAVLVWKITIGLIDSRRAAFWAVVLYAVEPVGLLSSEQLLSETLFTTLNLLAIWLLLSFLRDTRRTTLMAAALAFGACAYVRPLGEIVGFFVGATLLFLPRATQIRQRSMSCVCFLAVFLAALGPWVVRNHFAAGFNGFSSSGGYELYYVSGAAVRARIQHVPFVDLAPGTGVKVTQIAPAGEPWRTIRAYPLTFAYVQARSSVVTMLDPYSTELLRRLGLYPREGGMLARLQDHGIVAAVRASIQTWPQLVSLVVLGLITCAYYVAAVYGFRTLPKDGAVALALLIVFFAIFSASAGSTARYRAPIMPMVCIAAGVAIARKGCSVNKSGVKADSVN